MADDQATVPVPQGATFAPAQTTSTPPASAATAGGAVPVPQGATFAPSSGASGDWTPPPASTGGAGGSWEPTLADKAHELADKFVATMPVVGPAHELAGVVQDWANKKLDPTNQKLNSPLKTFGLGVARDVAGDVRGATSPEGLATAGAAIAAPEIVGPTLVAHGIHSMISGWGDLRNPDVLQNELNSAGEVVGGMATAGEALNTGGGPVTQAIRKQAADKAIANAPSQQLNDFKMAVPPSKTAPYTDVDVHMARPYLDAEHAVSPIDSPKALEMAANNAVDKIEGRISQEIQARPIANITTNPLADAYAALNGSVRTDFLEAGMRELENYPLGFERAGGVKDPPLTLQKADDIRRQLNQDNKAILLKNNYDLATARATDPGFAAREAAAESLRDGIYDGLDKLGFKEARAMRRDEGSLLKIRNATLKQEFNGEKTVRQTATSGARKVAGTIAKKGLTGAGAAVGAKMAGVPGAIAGAELGSSAGDAAANAIAPGPMSRNNLLNRSFRPTPIARPPVQVTPRAEVAAATESTAANAGRIFFRASDGTTHSVGDQAGLSEARKIDPQLQIIEPGQ